VDFDPVAVGIGHGDVRSGGVVLVVDRVAEGTQAIGELRQRFGGLERERAAGATDRFIISSMQPDRTGGRVGAQRPPAGQGLVAVEAERGEGGPPQGCLW